MIVKCIDGTQRSLFIWLTKYATFRYTKPNASGMQWSPDNGTCDFKHVRFLSDTVCSISQYDKIYSQCIFGNDKSFSSGFFADNECQNVCYVSMNNSTFNYSDHIECLIKRNCGLSYKLNIFKTTIYLLNCNTKLFPSCETRIVEHCWPIQIARIHIVWSNITHTCLIYEGIELHCI